MRKRDRFIFSANLQSVSCNLDQPITLRRESYLLSERYATKRYFKLARQCRRRQKLIISDNGNFTRMKNIAKTFELESKVLVARAQKEAAQGRVTSATFAERAKLVARIVQACKEGLTLQDKDKIVRKQLDMRPNYSIGLEDFTIPCLMLTGLLAPVFKPKPQEIAKFQRQTYKLFAAQKQGALVADPRISETTLLMVLHAYDYNSAYKGARYLRDKEVPGLAISYGSPMLSKRWIKGIQLGRKWVKFDTPLPEKYLLAQSITIGALNGVNKPVLIHLLGVGSPILIALTAVMLPRSSAISIDSSSPIQDANDGNIYGSRNGLMKMKMWKLAAFCLRKNKPYTSRTPYWKAFDTKHPSNWSALRQALGIHKGMSIKSITALLEANPDLVEANIPFFSKMRSGSSALMKDLRIYRSGHNYWILRNICANVRRRMHNPATLDEWVKREVERYHRYGSKKWALAVEQAFLLTQKYLRKP